MTRFLTYDVFTEARFGGNPLAVVPDATGLAEADLQSLAREFNYSETTFVYPPADPAHSARVRIFTPGQEVPFAGHPVIGTAVALADLGRGSDLVLELGVGPVLCRVDGHTARFTTHRPLERLAEPDPALVAACLTLTPSDIRTDTHAPVLAGLGLGFCFVELASTAALDASIPSLPPIREAAARHPGGLDFPIFAYTRDGGRIEARMFAPLDGIPEDPATGSASAALAALLADLSGGPFDAEISQGVAMGRPSKITARAAFEDGKVTGVTVAGSAVRVLDGRITPP